MQARIASQSHGQEPFALLLLLFDLGPAWGRLATPYATDDIGEQTLATAARGGTDGEERYVARYGKATDQREHSRYGSAEVPVFGEGKVSHGLLQAPNGGAGIIEARARGDGGEDGAVGVEVQAGLGVI